MRVVYYQCGGDVDILDIDGSLESMQDLVHGYIEEYPLTDTLSLICNEEGKINGMPFNRSVIKNGDIQDMIFGDFFVVAIGDEDFRDMTDDEIEQAIDFQYISPLDIKTDSYKNRIVLM